MKITIEDKKNKTIITTEPVVENGRKGEKVKIDFTPAVKNLKKTNRKDVWVGFTIMKMIVDD